VQFHGEYNFFVFVLTYWNKLFVQKACITINCVQKAASQIWFLRSDVLELQIDTTPFGQRSSDFAHNINRKPHRHVFIARCHDFPLWKSALQTLASIA
jgi:hypothetical protein